MKAGLNVKQTHLFLGILLELLEVAKQQKPYDEAAQGLQAAILAHCAGEAAPDKFVLTDVKAMTGFLAKTFLAHYSLYTYVFTQEQDTTTIKRHDSTRQDDPLTLYEKDCSFRNGIASNLC